MVRKVSMLVCKTGVSGLMLRLYGEQSPEGGHTPTTSRKDSVLNERDQRILTFERSWQNKPGGKEDAIRASFLFSPARYYQILSKLIFTREALEFDPELVTRLQRLYTERRRARSARIQGNVQK